MINTICYIDPASTALIWQILAGIFISLGVVFGIFWRKITTFFKSLWVKIFRKKKDENSEKKEIDESLSELEEVSEEVNVEEKNTTENIETDNLSTEDTTNNENKEN